MSQGTDWALVANLNLNAFLLEVLLANLHARMPGGGEAELAALRVQVLDRMVNRCRSSEVLPVEDDLERAVHFRTMTEHAFDQIEARRAEIAAARTESFRGG